jgi:hypothetical protein
LDVLNRTDLEAGEHVYRTWGTVIVLTLLLAGAVPAGCAPANSPPEITSLTPRSRVIAPGDSVLVECVATDVDGDELTYEWASDRGATNGYAGVVAWTAPMEEGLARVTVTVTDGGEVTATGSVAIAVKRNTLPLVQGVTPAQPWVRPGEGVVVNCNAEDADGDTLTYTWSADCGQISGTGASVTWTAPDSEGECVVTVMVDDGYEGTATGSASIATSQFEPLLVTGMTVAPASTPAYLVPRNDWYKVYWEDEYVIQCTVTEPERIVSYEWSDGKTSATFPVNGERMVFDEDPSKVRWTAPRERGEYTMTVTVRDALGNGASKSITVFVESCTCGFPNG